MAVVIYGHGSHGDDIANNLPHPEAVTWVDDNRGGEPISRLNPEKFNALYLGVNDQKTRAKLARTLPDDWAAKIVGWVHPFAIVERCEIGDDCHINAGAFLTRCELGHHVTVSPGATICGDVTIGNEVMVGAGAVVKNLIKIGDGATIGCGAVVVKDVEPGQTV